MNLNECRKWNNMKRDELLTIEDVADFVWMWGETFFLETPKGNYLWSDPDYGGDNSIKKYDGNLKKYCKETGTPYGRDKGRHFIRAYCGEDVKIKE